jgi:filamentous hemagglutinin
MPFQDTLERDLHFAKHGHEFGASDAIEYERMADAFMFGAMAIEVRECTRPHSGDRIRFGFITYRFGVVCAVPQFVRTFHVVRLPLIMRHGGTAGYFAWQCGKIFT